MSNRILLRKHTEQENNLMSKKLNVIKSSIRANTPTTFKNKIPKQGKVENFKDFCKRQNDYFLFKKLNDIYTNESLSKSNNKHPTSNPKKALEQTSYKKKWELSKIANENHLMLRRIRDSQPKYKQSSLEKDFKLSQKYVKNLCAQPISDPNIKRYTSTNFLIDSKNKTSKSFYSNNKDSKNSTTNSNFKTFTNGFNITNNFQQNQSKEKILYTRKLYLDNLGCTDIAFIIEENNFYITIVPLAEGSSFTYTIIFSKSYNIQTLLTLYSSYEDIISNIIYTGNRIRLKKKSKNLIYVSSIM